MFRDTIRYQFKIVKISFNYFQNQLQMFKMSCVFVVRLYGTFQNVKVMINKEQHFSRLGRPKGCRVRKQME